MNPILDFSSVNAALQRAEAGIEAAECHGELCGMLCAQREFNPQPWLAHMIGSCDADNVFVGETAELLGTLGMTAARELTDPEFAFTPLLPDDEQSLQVRTQALSQWCQGFMQGLRMGGRTHPEKISGDAGEIVRDLAEIAKAGHFQVEDSNENEADFAELVEYLRAGVRLVYDELRAEQPKSRRRRPRKH